MTCIFMSTDRWLSSINARHINKIWGTGSLTDSLILSMTTGDTAVPRRKGSQKCDDASTQQSPDQSLRARSTKRLLRTSHSQSGRKGENRQEVLWLAGSSTAAPDSFEYVEIGHFAQNDTHSCANVPHSKQCQIHTEFELTSARDFHRRRQCQFIENTHFI